MIIFEVFNRFTGKVQFIAEIECAEDAPRSVKLRLAVNWAAKNNANLADAYLAGANLADANLAGADLAGANLAGAFLAGADLAGANLAGAFLARANLARANLADANFADADLAGANLARVNLARVNLAYANLARANLAYANLAYANLAYANLERANLAYANLADANLERANLARAKNLHFSHVPEEGAFIGWKKAGSAILKLEIPADAKRTSSIIGRKCRAEYVKVLTGWIDGNPMAEGETVNSERGGVYTIGEEYYPDSYNDDPRVECTHGVHFFITRAEAEEW